MVHHSILKAAIFAAFIIIFNASSLAQDAPEPADAEAVEAEAPLDPPVGVDAPIADLEQPLYSPFTARFLLDEQLKMRTELERLRAELIERQTQREYQVAENATAYAQRAVEYFFYIIIAVTTLLVFLGWSSLRDVKSRINEIAEARVGELVQGYSERLDQIEGELKKKSAKLKEAQKEIDLTNEVHSLWLRASQEATPAAKIAVYDEIMRLRPDDVEAMTYKADAALALNEPQWALSLCNRALEKEPDNAHAFYQRACSFAATGFVEEAMDDLRSAISRSESLRIEARNDDALDALKDDAEFLELTDISLPTADEGGRTT